MQAYCVKCKEKKDITDPVQVEMKNGVPAVQGKCGTCGTKLTRMGAKLS